MSRRPTKFWCKHRNRLTQRVAAALLVLAAGSVSADGWIPLRNHNPYLHIYGLPGFEGAEMAGEGVTTHRFALDIVNHAEANLTPAESIVIDGESYYFNFSFRHGVSERLELGMDLPLVAHTDGVLDNAIEGWHDLWGLSNSKRQGPSNELQFAYSNPRVTDFSLMEPSVGIGDVRLTAAFRLTEAKPASGRSLALKAGLKLPTGDADDLLGSGALDFSLGLYGSAVIPIGRQVFDVAGFAGVLLTGDSDRFAGIQENTVPFAGAAAKWRLTTRFELSASLYAQGHYMDSGLEELGGNSVQLAVGGSYRFPNSGLSLSFGLLEDIVANTTPDVGFHVSIHRRRGQSAGP